MPQGSDLGLVLLSICIYDLDKGIGRRSLNLQMIPNLVVEGIANVSDDRIRTGKDLSRFNNWVKLNFNRGKSVTLRYEKNQMDYRLHRT